MAEAKRQELTVEEKLTQALVSEEEQPYEVLTNWIWTRINYLAFVTKLAGFEYTKFIAPNLADNGIPLFKGKNVQNGELVYSFESFIPKEISDQLYRSQLNKKCLLTPYVGTIGNVALFDGNIRSHLGSNVGKIEILNDKSTIMFEEFLLYFLRSTYGYNELTKHKKATAQESISIEAIRDVCIPLPPLAEQQRIVDRIESLFAKLDQAKELAQSALDTFETRKAAILHKAFTGELTAKWREKNGVGMESWSIKLLKDTDLEIIDGDRGINYPKKEDFSSEGYCLFLNAKNVTKNGFVFEELQFISKTKDRILRKGRLERGDIVLTTRGTIGNIAYFDDNIPYEHMRINSGMVIYRGGKEFYKPYLCYLYQSDNILNQISSIQTGSAQPQLPIKIMRELKLPIPSFSEQQEIVRIIDSVIEKEQKAKELCDVIDKIDLMKKAILARAFRGELGTNDPSEESAVELLKECLK